MNAVKQFANELLELTYADLPIRGEVDSRDMHGGAKNWEWIKKGAPIRIEIGPRDIEKGTISVARRDQSPKEKQFIESTKFLKEAENILEDIQSSLLNSATTFRDENMISIETMDEFIKFFTPLNSDKPEIHGGFALCHWAGSNEEEEKIAKDYKVTIRCIPNGDKFIEDGKCILTGKPSNRRVIFSKAY